MRSSASSQLAARHCPLPFGPGAHQRVQHAILAVQVIGDLADLAADEAVGERAAAIAVDLDHAAVVDGDRQAAQIGAVERTRAAVADLRSRAAPDQIDQHADAMPNVGPVRRRRSCRRRRDRACGVIGAASARRVCASGRRAREQPDRHAAEREVREVLLGRSRRRVLAGRWSDTTRLSAARPPMHADARRRRRSARRACG